MPKKSWEEKFDSERSPFVKVSERKFADIHPGDKILLTTPRQVADYIGLIPKGDTRSFTQMRQDLATQNKADKACPVVAGISLRIVAEVMTRKLESGFNSDQITPVWRVLEPGSNISKKLELGAQDLFSLRDAEQSHMA